MKRHLIWFLPVVILIVISLYGFWHGSSGMWHDQCKDFWQKQKWHELKALAGNLDRTNRADSETLYLAARACYLIQDPSAATYFASRYLQERPLNWSWEMWLAKNYHPQRLMERLRLYRTRAIITIFAAVTFLNLLSLWKNWNTLPWGAIFSFLGIVLLVI